eukprot:521102-Lingulodinium_polyedra.AAC.1
MRESRDTSAAKPRPWFTRDGVHGRSATPRGAPVPPAAGPVSHSLSSMRPAACCAPACARKPHAAMLHATDATTTPLP